MSARLPIAFSAMLILALAGCGDSNDDKATSAAADPEAGEASDWSYSGPTGPAQWSDLNPKYKECSIGKAQSPIDLTDPKDVKLAPIEFTYESSVRVDQENNGHSIESAVPDGNTIDIGGKRYKLTQFHLHAPSEHHVDGKAFPIEIHFVHTADDGAVALTVFVKEGAENAAWLKLLDGMPAKKGEQREVDDVELAKLIAPNEGDSQRYSYEGSLTTPPCSEGVQFNIYTEPIELSADQIAAFTALYDDTNRPIQPRNDRTLELGP